MALKISVYSFLKNHKALQVFPKTLNYIRCLSLYLDKWKWNNYPFLNLSVEIKLEINSTSNHYEIVKLIENEFDHLDGNAFYASIHAIDKKIIELMDLTPNQVRNNFGFLKTYFELNEKR